MIEQLELTPRTLVYGAGVYEAGDTEACYVKLFVTDTGYVMPVNHRMLTEDDLLEVYVQGRNDEARGRKCCDGCAGGCDT